jgi:hypothetical protein
VAEPGPREDDEVRRCTAPALVFVVLLGAAFFDEQHGGSSAAEACRDPAAPRVPTPPPLLTLRTRGHEVAVYPGERLGFTVLDQQGRVLAERIDEAQFALRFPALHEQLDAAFATSGPRLDATALRRPGGTGAAVP